MTQKVFRLISSVSRLLLAVVMAKAQNTQKFTLTSEALQNAKGVELGKVGWKYRSGDDLNRSVPQTDDSAWKSLEESSVNPHDLKADNWNGRGWFRLRLTVDKSLVN